MPSKRPLGGFTKRNPLLSIGMILVCAIVFFMTDVVHATSWIIPGPLTIIGIIAAVGILILVFKPRKRR